MARLGLITLTLIAFAANSVLCRWALAPSLIDPGSFTFIRLASGALALWLIVSLRSTMTAAPSSPAKARGSDSETSAGDADSSSTQPARPCTLGAVSLFVYAVCFSYAYIGLNTATGALILFAVVQVTLIALGLLQGQRLNGMEWLGLMIAFAGFAWLMLPTASRPPVSSAILMALAGVAWGFYTWNGRSARTPLQDTARNFRFSLPMAIVTMVAVIAYAQTHLSTQGIILAVASGALASGCGYALWYSILPSLKAAQAGILQLLVPVIAALGGVLFVGEALTWHLATAGLITLSGIAILFKGRFRSRSG